VGLRGNCDSVAWQVTIRNAGKLFHERLALAGHRPGDGLHRGVCGRGRIPCRPRETVGFGTGQREEESSLDRWRRFANIHFAIFIAYVIRRCKRTGPPFYEPSLVKGVE
jgi:hypothetical protein